MNKFCKKFQSQKGLSLVEVMIAMTITGVVVGFVSRFFIFSKNQIRNLTSSHVMIQIAKQVENAIQRPDVVSLSATLNRDLKTCAFGGDRLCTDTDSRHQVPFELYQVPKNVQSFRRDKLKIAGTTQQPVYYSSRGHANCDPKDPECIFEVIAYFWATCAGDTTDSARASSASLFEKECHRAQVLNLRYQVIHRLGKFRPIPTNESFWKGKDHTTNFAVSIHTSQLGVYADYIQSCPANYSLMAVQDSTPICQCLKPYKEITKNVCILDHHTCLPSERYQGTSLDGTPVCKKTNCTEKIITSTDQLSFDFNCAPDGWINKIEVLDGNPKNCVCKDRNEESGPNFQLATWRAVCQLDCSFKVTCCRE